jgi:hypothetical protein
MAAIITDRIKKIFLQQLDDDVAGGINNYYVGVGRPIDWNNTDDAPDPENTGREIRNAQVNLMSIKKIEAHSFVIPRYSWSFGSIYSGYNDNTDGHPLNSYYVLTDENKVFVCLEQGKNANGQAVTSTVKPISTATSAFELADGYRWKFLYSIGSLRTSQFVSANFIPVDKFTSFDSSDTIDVVQQVGIHNAATPGQITGYTMTNNGSGYTTVPTVNVVGDGISARGAATISGGQVTKIEVKDSGGGDFAFGTGYTWASLEITGGGGTGATARPVLAPSDGFGSDPREDLRSQAIMFSLSPTGSEGDTWVTDNDFRQVCLIRNPTLPNSNTLFTAETGNAMYKMRLSSNSVSFSPDKTIEGSTSGAEAHVATIDSDFLYYIQTETTGFTPFSDGEAINETDGDGQGIADSASIPGDINKISGDVIFIDNRAAVQRADDQTEDIKIIIQL